MSKRSAAKAKCTVAHVCHCLENIAPPGLAQSWDNVGLIAGDLGAPVERVLLCIDLTQAVVAEAVSGKAGLILAYHPPILKPISSLSVPGDGTDATVFRCVRQGIAVYATHTALDAADGGTNDVLAELCGIVETEPIEYVESPDGAECKIVVFVPREHVEAVADAMFDAGAGRIGDYTRCSFRAAGQGTFLGGLETQPVVGKRGRLERVDEVRLEIVTQAADLAAVVQALRSTHPYEEPAFDLYPLKGRPVRGMGRVGPFTRVTTLGSLARKLKRVTHAACVQIVGSPDHEVDRAVIVAGSAGSLPFRVPPRDGDCLITGEIRHHDALTLLRRGGSAVALGHWTSERPVLFALAEQLQGALPGVRVRVSAADSDPFRSV